MQSGFFFCHLVPKFFLTLSLSLPPWTIATTLFAPETYSYTHAFFFKALLSILHLCLISLINWSWELLTSKPAPMLVICLLPRFKSICVHVCVSKKSPFIKTMSKVRDFWRAANLVAEAQTWNISIGAWVSCQTCIYFIIYIIYQFPRPYCILSFSFWFEQTFPPIRDEGACSFLYMLSLRTNFGSSFSSCFRRNWYLYTCVG